ncbi:MAG: GNAT family N-acetyltransferase [Candidatus Doudnabacteria bacterium]|nr:GNAT family N-acetyltransferase [Candidatus Doudnabacteria bacterium]
MNKEVSLRMARVEDAESMIFAMDFSSLQNFSFFDKPPTIDRQRAYLEKLAHSTHDVLYVICHEDRIIGTCGLHEIDRDNHNARIGVMIFSPEFRGHGLGAAAIRKLLTVGFGTYQMHKLYFKVFAENTISCTKYAHLGFQFEARLKEQYYLKGEYHDMVVMSVFAREWKG